MILIKHLIPKLLQYNCGNLPAEEHFTLTLDIIILADSLLKTI